MPLHPKIAAILEHMRTKGAKPTYQMTAQEARKHLASLPRSKAKEPVATQDRNVANFRVRIYTPEAKKPLPILLYFHSGGWVIGDLEMADARCHLLAKETPCIVISVDYRLAPEHRFPAAVEDAFAATEWAYVHARELGGDPEKIAVGGESSGGNLAAVVALLAREKGSPPIVFQWLIYAGFDADFSRASYQKFGHDYFLEKESMTWCWHHYLPKEEERKNPYASPLHAKSLKGLAPAYIATAEYDILLDEGNAYAERLKKEGVPVRTKCFQGMVHSFLIWMDVVPEIRQNFQEMIEELRRGFRNLSQ